MNILPRIKSYQELDGQWKIGKALKVKGDMSFLKLGINLLKNHYSAFDIAVEEGGEDSSIFAERITERGGEANEYYEIEITERRIVVRYTDMLSFRNAAATIIALTQSLRGEFFIRCCRLEDYADFSHRGFMLDVARQYIEPELIRERILLMAKAKYTILHLHLFDTERYALYSEAVPKLNCEPIFRQYSKAEMREIVAYAAGLGIDIIPELDFPGHGLFVLSKLPDIRCEKDGEKIGIWDMCVSNENTYQKLRRHFKALQAIEDLREANIGIIGHVFRGMYDIELSKTFLKSAFGVNIILIQNSHLMEVWEKVEESEVEKEKAKLLSRFKRKNVSEEDVGNAVRLAVAMRKISEKFHLNAMCFLDQHFIQKQVKTSARIGASLLMENTDMCVNCEGDLGGLVAEMLLKSLSDKNPLMAEWGEYDEETNSVLLIGHGIGTPDLASSEKEVLLSRTPEEWGFEGSGLNYELVVKEGDYTISHIFETPEGYRLLISPVEGIEFPRLDFDEIHALVKVKSPVTQYLQKLLETGVSHHAVLGWDDVSEELKSVARFLNIDSFFIE